MSSGEIMTPVDLDSAERMALIHAMRVQADVGGRQADAIDRLTDTVQRVSEDVAVLKSQDVRAEIGLAMQATVDLRRDWQEDCRRRDERIQTLLQESLEDRRKLWLAHETCKSEDAKMQGKMDTAVQTLEGKLNVLTARIIPLLTIGSLVMAAIVAFLMERVLK